MMRIQGQLSSCSSFHHHLAFPCMVAQMAVVVYKLGVQMEEEDLLYHQSVRRRVSLGPSPRKPPGDALTKQLVRDEL